MPWKLCGSPGNTHYVSESFLETLIAGLKAFNIVLLDTIESLRSDSKQVCNSDALRCDMYSVGQRYVRQSVQLKIYPQEKSADLLSWASPLRFMVYFHYHSPEASLQF